MNYKSIPTSVEVYAVIFARHKDQLEPYGSYSDPTGTSFGGDGTMGQMNTVYAIEGCPVIEINTKWEITNNVPHEYVSQYWLCIALEENK